MDSHADTGTWMRTEVPTPDLDAVKRRLYTLANKAGYSLRTETSVACEATQETDEISVLRLLVRTREATTRGAA